MLDDEVELRERVVVVRVDELEELVELELDDEVVEVVVVVG